MRIDKLEEILSDDLKERIIECDRKIRQFIELINTELPEEHKLPNPKMHIHRYKGEAFEDDGNTKTAGYDYKIYWNCPVDKETIDISEKLMLLNCISNSLYFCYEDRERIRDKYSNGHNRFLSLYISIEELSRDKSKTQRIDYNNDNYELTSIVNYNNASICILKLKEFFKQRELVAKLKTSSMLED